MIPVGPTGAPLSGPGKVPAEGVVESNEDIILVIESVSSVSSLEAVILDFLTRLYTPCIGCTVGTVLVLYFIFLEATTIKTER